MDEDFEMPPVGGMNGDDEMDFGDDASFLKVGEEKEIQQGLKKKLLKEGEGFETPENGDEVEVHYTGTLLDGTKFDSSRDRGTPFKFTLGQGQVIKGWDIGIKTMKKGENAVFTIPSELAYGESGSPPAARNRNRFLNKAKLNNKISATEVEETRTFLALLPIFASTIVMNCCLAQLSTYSVQQGMLMNRKLSKSFEVPPASLNTIALLFMLSSIAFYELFGKRISSSNNERSSSFNLKRIGTGLALTSVAMAIAAIVEAKRKHEAVHNNIKISVFWLEFQYVLLSFSDVLTLGGMLEFFYRESPASMKSISTALGWFSTALGFFLSTVLVDVTKSVTGWLDGEDVNGSRLELFYALLPRVFVGKEENLRTIVRESCVAANWSLKSRGLSLPPWRRFSYLQHKWFGLCRRRAGSSLEVTTLNKDAVSCCSVGFDDAVNARLFIRT
ncbi:hypothetical protein F2Q69_00004308 [Brassica cretica]|uniref:peptidylprolyl isomerase n=1 Tax=Brassica cretica TaxID=69181 RepID=A0A8S9P5C5_BRACR|nr:hypothetical protein F2Q69_00004308 [Brassica cretica]